MSRKRRIARQKNVFRRADYPDAYCDVKWEEYPDQDLVNFTIDIFDGTSISWLGKRSTLTPIVYEYKSDYVNIGNKFNDDGSIQKSIINHFKVDSDKSLSSVHKYIRDNKHKYDIMDYEISVDDKGMVDFLSGWWHYNPCSYIDKHIGFTINNNRWILSFGDTRYFKKRGLLKKESLELKLDLVTGEIVKFCSLKRFIDRLTEITEVLSSNSESEPSFMKKETTIFEMKSKNQINPFVPDNAVYKAVFINANLKSEETIESACNSDAINNEGWLNDINSAYIDKDRNYSIDIYPYKDTLNIEKNYLEPELKEDGFHVLNERWGVSKKNDRLELNSYYIRNKKDNLRKNLSYETFKDDDKGEYQARLQYIYLTYFDKAKGIKASRNFEFDNDGFVKKYKDLYLVKNTDAAIGKDITIEMSIENIKNSLNDGAGEIRTLNRRYEANINGICTEQIITNGEPYENDERKLRVPEVLRLSNTYSEGGSEYVPENLIAHIIATNLSENKLIEWKEIMEDAKSRN